MNIINIFDDFGIKYYTTGKNTSPGWINTKCVWCDDISNHLGWSINTEKVYCWKCGGHDFDKTLAKILDIPKNKIISTKLDYTDRIRLKAKPEIEKTKKNIKLPGYEFSNACKKYIEKRGFNFELIKNNYKITYGGIIGDWKFRIIIPIFFHNKLVSFQGRDITDKQKIRYKTLSNKDSIIPPKNILYNLDNCNEDYIIVVEGVFDVWRFGENSAATFGSSITEHQIKCLLKYKKVIFLFDGEKEAQKKAYNACMRLASFGIESEIAELEKGDPADLNGMQALLVKNKLELRCTFL